MQHERFFAPAFDGVDDLRVAAGAEGGDHDGLGLAAGEQRRAVGTGQHADLDGDGTHGLGVAPVDAGLALDDAAADDLLLEIGEGALHQRFRVLALAFTGELGDGCMRISSIWL